ncbi:Domain of unknown function DUF637, haemagglutinin putative [Comamonadaceae bacterium]
MEYALEAPDFVANCRFLSNFTNRGLVDGGNTATTSTQTQASVTTAQVSTINAKNISVIADQKLVSVGTEFKGTESLCIEGKHTTTLYAATNTRQSTTTTQSTTTLGGALSAIVGGITLEDKTSTDSAATASSIGTKLISNEKVTIGVGNKTELQGTDIQSPQTSFVKTDPSKAGELILGASKDTTQTSRTEKSETAGVWQEQKGQGSTTQTLNQTRISGNVNFDNALKITVQIPDTKGGQELKSQINALASQSGGTGLEYLNQLAANPNIQWDKVALANEKWSYSQAGLTPAGAALLTIAVAAGTGGMGAGLTGTTGALGTAMSAGFSSLASQAAVSLVNNGGDIGKTLEQLGKEESIKGLLLTMATAGALDKLNANYFKGIDAKSPFIDQLQKNLTNNVATDLMNSALAGKPFDENSLASSLKNALINTGTAQGANAIGDGLVNNNLNEFTHKLAHAVLGCAGAEASGGDCRSGAVGAVVGELTAEYAIKSGMNNSDALALAKVLAATSGVMTGGGGDNAAAVNTAATAGANAAENNYLKHKDVLKLANDLEKCGPSDQACKDNAIQAAAAISAANDAELLNCKASNNCATLTAEFRKGYAAISDLLNQGASASDVTRIQNLETTAQLIIKNEVYNKVCTTKECTDRASTLAGVGKGLGKITPAGMVAGAGLVAYELTTSILQNGVSDTAISIVQGIADLPSNLRAALNSSDPAVRGEALVDALSLASVSAVVTAKLGPKILENTFAGPSSRSLAAQRGGVKIGVEGANGGVNPTLLNELTANGVKFTPENVIATTRGPSGQVVFLETGNSRAGLQHIVGEHANDFANIGVSQAEIPNVVMQAVSQGKIVGYQGSGTGRPIFETVINGQPRRLAITISDNGFIVGANPKGSVK